MLTRHSSPFALLSLLVSPAAVTASEGSARMTRDGIPRAAGESLMLLCGADACSPAFKPTGLGDVNGDGFADVALASTLSDGDTLTHQLYVFHGIPDAPSVLPARVQSVPTDGFAFPTAFYPVAAGDLNGDGYDDMIAALADYQGTNRIDVYHGSPGGIGDKAAATYQGSHPLSTFDLFARGVGDVNGDGFDDVLLKRDVGPELHYGSAGGLSGVAARIVGPPDTAWSDIAGIGDVNGDGFDDIALGHQGKLLIFHGAADGPSDEPTLTDPAIARVVSGAGDVNGDCYDDVMVGAEDMGIWVYHGGPAGLESVAPADAEVVLNAPDYPQFAATLARLGDVDGDGYDDVWIGARRTSLSGTALLYRGSPAGLSPSPDAIVGEPGLNFELTPTEVAGAGDFNGDGRTDAMMAIRSGDAIAEIFLGHGDGAPTPLLCDEPMVESEGEASESGGDTSGTSADNTSTSATQGSGPGLDGEGAGCACALDDRRPGLALLALVMFGVGRPRRRGHAVRTSSICPRRD